MLSRYFRWKTFCSSKTKEIFQKQYWEKPSTKSPPLKVKDGSWIFLKPLFAAEKHLMPLPNSISIVWRRKAPPVIYFVFVFVSVFVFVFVFAQLYLYCLAKKSPAGNLLWELFIVVRRPATEIDVGKR